MPLVSPVLYDHQGICSSSTRREIHLLPLTFPTPDCWSATGLLKAKAAQTIQGKSRCATKSNLTAKKPSLSDTNVHNQEKEPIKCQAGGGIGRSEMKQSHGSMVRLLRVITTCRSQSVYPRGNSHLPFSSHACLGWCSTKTKKIPQEKLDE